MGIRKNNQLKPEFKDKKAATTARKRKPKDPVLQSLKKKYKKLPEWINFDPDEDVIPILSWPEDGAAQDYSDPTV